MRHNVWAIRNDRDYLQARAIVDDLVMRKKLSPADSEKLEIMLTLMEAHEARNEKKYLQGVSPIETLKTLLDEHEMSASDLGRLLGNRALGSLILNGKRELSKAHIRKLSNYFSVDPSLFF